MSSFQENKVREKATRMLNNDEWLAHLERALKDLKPSSQLDAALIGALDAMMYDVGNQPDSKGHEVAKRDRRSTLLKEIWSKFKNLND